MLWFILALGAAIADAGKDALRKGILKDSDEYSLAFFASLVSALFLLPVVIWQGIPEIGQDFIMAAIAGTISISVAQLLILKALKHSDLSLCSPLLAFSPLILLITSPLMLGEYPSLLGIGGVLLIVAGSYALNASRAKQGILSPFRYLLQEKGPRYFLIVALIYGVSANIDKIGIINSSASFWVFAVNGLCSAVFLIALLARKNTSAAVKGTLSKRGYVILLGLVNTMMLLFHMSAIQLTNVAYAISVKRTSILFGVLFGVFLFREKGLKERLTGAAIMVIGVLMITLS
jgi:drug/metabolite transporter (DMT)-like permease